MKKLVLFFVVILMMSSKIRSDTAVGCLETCSTLGYFSVTGQLDSPYVYGCFKNKNCYCASSCSHCSEGEMCVYKWPNPYDPTSISSRSCYREGKYCR